MINDIWEFLRSSKFKICFIAALWGFLTGLERAVIIPTLWFYFSTTFSETAASEYYGWTMASFGVAILICDPLFGYLSYIKVRVKTLLVISNQLGIIGNIIYFIASHPWMLLVGRFLAGAGAGCEVPLYADIVRITTVSERTPYIVTLLLCRQFGLIFGPACTVTMSNIQFKIGQVSINKYNGPGLLLAILWGVHTILVLLIYPQLSKEKRKDDAVIKKEITPLINLPTSNTPMDVKEMHRMSCCSDVIDEAIKQKINSPQTIPEENENSSDSALERFKQFLVNNYEEYCRFNVLSTLFIIFSSYFSLMGLEAVLPPMAKENFKWSVLETSWVYLGCGLSVVVVYIILRIILSKGYKDKYLMLTGLLFLTLSYLWLTICLSIINKDKPKLYIALILIGIGFHVIGQPFVVSCSESLYTKQISIDDQDRAQSILRVVINIALLIGPFVGGSLEVLPNVVFIVMLILIGISTALLVFRYKLFDY